MSYSEIERCRVCGCDILVSVLELGDQALTGVFPDHPDREIVSGPLRLIKCHGQDSCGLLQLASSFDVAQMYGDNYGYRSGLNASMVEHLCKKVRDIEELQDLADGDLVIDVGSNDGTTLSAYQNTRLDLLGVDPTAEKFKKYYPDHVAFMPEFFSRALVEKYTAKKAKVITSFSMFYDLEDPLEFMRQVMAVLSSDGIWVFEQSYMPKMMESNSFDTVCHEHLEFYGLYQIKWMTETVGFNIVDVQFNDINGGSFSVVCAKAENRRFSESPLVAEILSQEVSKGLLTLGPYLEFAKRVASFRSELRRLLIDLRKDGKRVVALGASTKGNVLLQYCQLDASLIESVAEVNAEKFGRFTPGTGIPIVNEDLLLKSTPPDFVLVLPWHFRSFFEKSKKFSSIPRIYPLPDIEIVW